MTINDRIKYLREKQHLSQQELALLVGYKDKSAISKVEMGYRDIGHSMIKKYAIALNTTVAFLMGLEENERIPNIVSNLSVGLRIKNIRESLNLTQEDLALRVGYTSRSSINKIENGLVDLPTSKVISIASALNTSPAFLLGIDQNITIDSKLTDLERDLLNLLRQMPSDVCVFLIKMLNSMLNKNLED